MSGAWESNRCPHTEDTSALALQALPAAEVPAAEAHIAGCADCAAEARALREVVGTFAAWPADVLRPGASVQERLARRIAEETGEALCSPPAPGWSEPEWEEVAPGISCKLLANDVERDRVSMLVRLVPNGEYPPHTHAGLEELHLLQGELWIDGRKLYPGDYNRASAFSADQRVWSETGCTCVLITSTQDILR